MRSPRAVGGNGHVHTRAVCLLTDSHSAFLSPTSSSASTPHAPTPYIAMSTTDILFNSPALHSLKRAQLVQLCKRHNIKATGKNPDIVDRLKKHALTLPPDAPLHLAVRSEAPRQHQGSDETDEDEDSNNDENTFDFRNTNRPSEMWEVVMDDIPEEESGSLRGTLKSMGSIRSHGEFGSSGSMSEFSVFRLLCSIAWVAASNVPLCNTARKLKFFHPHAFFIHVSSRTQVDIVFSS